MEAIPGIHTWKHNPKGKGRVLKTRSKGDSISLWGFEILCFRQL